MMTHDRVRNERSALVLILALLLLGLAGFTHLAAQGTTATIVGTATDTSGASVPGAAIQVKNVGTGAVANFETDSQGRFTAPDLAIGEYEVQASKASFQTVVRKGITLTVGGRPVVDFSLPVGQSQQTVTVTSDVTQVETQSSAVSSLTDQRQMSELPLNGRNFEQLILLAPGVQYFSAVSLSGAQGRSTAYSVSGSRSDGQALLLDGENMQTFWNRGMASITGSSLGIDAIAEFQTLTNTYSAQFGGNGAVINSVSKSGTNSFHGSAYEFLRNSAMDARGFFDPGNSPPPFRRNQFGGTLGGPIKPNKAFFFVNYEGVRQALGETEIADVPACNLVPGACTITATNPVAAKAIAGALALYPAAQTSIGGGIGEVTQVANQVANENYVLARFDYNFSDKDSLFVRYLSDKADFLDPFNSSDGTLLGWPGADTSHNQFAAVEWKRIVSPTLVNIARASFSRPASAEAPSPNHPATDFWPGTGRVDGTVSIPGLSTLGPNGFNPFVQNQNKFSEGDDIIWTRGAHTVTTGISVTRFQTNTLQTGGLADWTFNSFTDFLAGNASQLVGTPLGSYPHFDMREIEVMPYINDTWKIRSNLTLNLGLRWDYGTNPVTPHNTLFEITDYVHGTNFEPVSHLDKSNPSVKNIAPRVGLAYDPFADHKTSIRAGFGIFYDMITPSVYFPGLSGQPPWENLIQLNPVYPIPLAGGVAPPLPSNAPGWDYFTAVTPYMIQYNVTIQRELAAGSVLSVGYVGARGVHLFNGTDQNPVIPTIDSSGVYHFGTVVDGNLVPNPRVNPLFGNFDNNIPAAYSRYNSLQANLTHRLSRNVEVQAAYTYSQCMDNGGSGLGALSNNSSSVVENPYDRRADYGPCAQDIRHTLRVNGLVTLPFHGNRFVEGWQISGIVSATTGLPFNISDGFDNLGVSAGTNPGATPRPDYIPGCQVQVGTVKEWFNPACFTASAPGTLGDLGRDTGRGPDLQNTDLSLSKDTRIKEGLHVQFRAEVFDIFNHPNFGLPHAAALNPGAGRITKLATLTPARQIQLGLKFIF